MLRIVLDTVVLVRSLLNPRSNCGRVVFRHSRRYRLFLSRPVVVEILEVWQRPELTNRFESLPGRDLNRVIEIIGRAEVVGLAEIPPVSRDPADDKFLATAVAARADYLVTEDDDLLVLSEHHGVEIVTCQEFLGLLEGLETQESALPE